MSEDNLYKLETNTRYVSSDMEGSPSLENTYGSLNNLLKVVLTEGFNKKSVVSITKLPSGGLWRIKLPLNHSFIVNQVVNIEGVVESAFNKSFRVFQSDADSITIIHLGDEVSATALEEGIYISVAPLGYELVYENLTTGILCIKNNAGASSSILKSVDALPPNSYDKGWVKYARVVVCQSIDSSGKPLGLKTPYNKDFPDMEITGDKVSGATGIHGFAKWDYAISPNSAASEAREIATSRGIFPTDWRVIGDDKTFYLMIRSMGKSNYSYNVLGYGIFNSFNTVDTHNTCLLARDGMVAANSSDSHNLARTRNSFGTLELPHSGFLLSGIYPNARNILDYNKFTNVGDYYHATQKERPWRSTAVESLNPVSGKWVTSLLHIKDSNNFMRGTHRGVQIRYGLYHNPDQYVDNTGTLNLYVQEPYTTTTYATMPLAFELRDWK